MKNPKHLLLFFSLIAFLFSCKQETEQKGKTQSKLKNYQTDYLPPTFTNDNRTEKILGAKQEIHILFEEYAQKRNIPGISYGIVVDDSMTLSGNYGKINLETEEKATTNSCFRIASMTKSFTAMAILKLRDEGLLDLDDPLSNYFPKLANLGYLTSDAMEIDLENLLTMTAGFPEDNPWGDRHLDDSNEEFEQLLSEGFSFSNVPSYEYEYSNTGYALLGQVINKVTGITYQKYITQNILLPLGMKDTYWEFEEVPENILVKGYAYDQNQWIDEPLLHDGIFGSMGGMITTIKDFSKYVSFHLSAWPARSEPENGPILRSSLREMHTPKFPRLASKNTDWNNELCPTLVGYGYGLGITQYCNGVIRVSHGGALPGFASGYAFYPEYGIGVMAFGNLTYTSPLPYNNIQQLLFSTLELSPRKKSVSHILEKRKNQLLSVIDNWDYNTHKNLFADNFILDRSWEARGKQISEIKKLSGKIDSVGSLRPRNQLRGDVTLYAENGNINLFFTLNPEADPKIQRLDLTFKSENDN
ncbi:CubicO group peptidase (beta-lactamase class C family) [Saonia flava]|uniref:CubicO group peptidase (Beta-lactamase class C family) n=1 Tax=Saonia flava TaxID=523696 RepID=A0A846QRH7_9FLAO|nr:serine hydrolase domain-containing protein [Saonia flava]NJB71616.1 CubicO group peptidase (beta-lactamase class C family) [Saonia flava]